MTSDRLRAFIDVILDSVDDPATGEELARRCFLSRFHFDRLVSSALGESPGSRSGDGSCWSARPTSCVAAR